MQRYEISRNEVCAHIYKAHSGFEFAVTVAGSRVVQGQHDELDQVRNHICYCARSLGLDAKTRKDATALKRAAILFTWAREARL